MDNLGLCKPKNGWSDFQNLAKSNQCPHIVYVPPFSALETHEEWKDDGPIRQSVGKAQPGSVLRNLLYRVIDREGTDIKDNTDWKEIKQKVREWFGVDLMAPEYKKGISTEIISEYKVNRKTFDIISGGSGFHQILTLLAFIYGYKDTTTILFDEPDAHLHVNLQRQIINYFKHFKRDQLQFLIATHSEEFIKNVDFHSVLAILSGKPTRESPKDAIIGALSDISNMDVIRTQENPYILYLEGEDDERILAAWAKILDREEVYQKFYPFVLGGPTKKEMKDKAEQHYHALKQIVPALKRAILLDYDSEESAINPAPDQLVLNEWKRKNIDNYLFVPEAWKRVVNPDSLFLAPCNKVIDSFFAEQNLSLPPNSTWKNVRAQIFSVLDGKKLLFEDPNSLFKRIKDIDGVGINRSMVASAMTRDEIHEDIELFFDHLQQIAL